LELRSFKPSAWVVNLMGSKSKKIISLFGVPKKEVSCPLKNGNNKP